MSEAISKFRKHYSEKNDDEKEKLIHFEFEELKKYPGNGKKYSASHQTGFEPAYKEFNRYRDIIPYDSTRVKLSHCPYVNASWVGKTYIATQGPKDNTVRHFWEIVIEKNINIIVMLCNLQECSINPPLMKDKCSMYWPKSTNEPKIIDGEGKMEKIKVTLQTEINGEFYCQRKLDVTTKKGIHTVIHFQMTNWPDHGVPEQKEDVKGLISEFRRHLVPKTPILLHCSAGVGRTGTVIAIDRVMESLKTDSLKNFTVLSLVRELREARPKMCQTEEQYGFIYDMVDDLFDKGNLKKGKHTKRHNLMAHKQVPCRPTSEYGGLGAPAVDNSRSKSLEKIDKRSDSANGITRRKAVRKHNENYESDGVANSESGLTRRKAMRRPSNENDYSDRARNAEPGRRLGRNSSRYSKHGKRVTDLKEDDELDEFELNSGPGATLRPQPTPVPSSVIQDEKKTFWSKFKFNKKDKTDGVPKTQAKNISKEFKQPVYPSSLVGTQVTHTVVKKHKK